MENEEREEKLGRTVFGFSWFFYALRIIVITSLIALAVLYLTGKPLWIAPIIGIGCYLLYRFVIRAIFRFIGWTTRE